MHRVSLLFLLLAASAALYVAQVLGIYLYDRTDIEWYFTPAHILGGVCIGLGAAYAMRLVFHRVRLSLVFVAVLGVGLAWEVWEYSWALPIPIWDTVSDVIADLFGGYIAYALAKNER